MVKSPTKKERDFCHEYVKTYNATQAYLAAFDCVYDTAKAAGYRLLKKPQIKEYIRELEMEAFEANSINAEHIANELSKMAFGEINEVNTTTTKLKALDLLQKQLSLQGQKISATVESDVNITIKVKEDE